MSARRGKLECDYCGSTYDVAEIEALYAEKEAKAAETQQKEEQKQAAKKQEAAEGGWDTSDMSDDWGDDADAMRAYSCPSCGAELICDETTAATSCPYCGNPTVVPGKFCRGAEAGICPAVQARKGGRRQGAEGALQGKALPAEGVLGREPRAGDQGRLRPVLDVRRRGRGLGQLQGLPFAYAPRGRL
ncbi:MAG: hypothetical protein V8T01_04220 [Oscillospiraceae bacterium]